VILAARHELGAYGLRGARLAFVAELQEAPELENPLPTLYEWLIQPIESQLPETLVIEPHGPLWQVPFAALGATSDTPLALRCAILLTPSNDVLNDIRTSPDYGAANDLPVLLVGNPTMPINSNYTFDPLPGADAEVTALNTLFAARNPTVFRSAAATKKAVQAALSQHGILHLATHGFADTKNPLASFVVLAPDAEGEESLLYASDLLLLDLPADLVVLSACQTGLGLVSGDGVIGLSRALLIAGARTVLVSLWNVDDAATGELMRHFYEHYLATDNKAAALRHAMTTFLANPATADPHLWAAFYLIGAEH